MNDIIVLKLDKTLSPISHIKNNWTPLHALAGNTSTKTELIPPHFAVNKNNSSGGIEGGAATNHDLQKMTSQTQKINMGRQASENSDLSGAEGRSGPGAGTAEASEAKANKWNRRKSRKIQGKIAKLAEDKILSTCILQNLDKALAKLRRGKDQVNMEVNENAEPGQASVGKERNAATPVSRIGEAWDFVNMGIEVETTPEVDLPLLPGWATHEEQGPEAEITY